MRYCADCKFFRIRTYGRNKGDVRCLLHKFTVIDLNNRIALHEKMNIPTDCELYEDWGKSNGTLYRVQVF